MYLTRSRDKRVHSFKQLEVYRLSLDLAQESIELTKGFPAEEKYSLADQIRRSSKTNSYSSQTQSILAVI